MTRRAPAGAPLRFAALLMALLCSLLLSGKLGAEDDSEKEQGLHELWSVKLAGNVQGVTPAVHDGKVLVGGGMSSTVMYCFDAETGRRKWKRRLDDNGPWSAVVEDERVYLATESCTIYTLDLASGKRIWKLWVGDPVLSFPAISGDSLYVSSGNAANAQWARKSGLNRKKNPYYLLRLDKEEGTIKWATHLGAELVCAPCEHQGKVYATCMDGALYCVDADRGKLRWKHEGAGSPPCVAWDGSVFIASGGSTIMLAKLNGETGDLIWQEVVGEREKKKERRWVLGGSQVPLPCAYGGGLYASAGSDLVCLDANTGRERWRVNPSGREHVGLTGPCVVKGKVVLGSRDGTLYCYSAEEGEQEWAYDLGEAITMSPSIVGGRIYVVTADGKLRCLETGDPALDGWGMWGGTPSHVPAPMPGVVTTEEPE